MPVLNRIVDLVPDVTEWRRDLHRHPELLYDLPRTSGLVAERLHAFGFDEIVTGLARTGVVGILHGRHGPGGRSIALRADMDALPIEEQSGQPWASGNSGLMHACGHDGHTAMLLGAARHLAETRAFDGTLVFVFQPAEEGGGGARAMIEDGLFERVRIDEIYGLHNRPGLAVGQFGIRPGPVMASADRFRIDIEGRGAHAAMPHQGVDPIFVGAQLVTALQSIVSRNVDPQSSAVLSVTRFNAGSADNIIPSTAVLTGTVRALDEAVRQEVEDRLCRMVPATAALFGATATIDFRRGYPVTANDPEAATRAAEAAAQVVGAANVDLGIQAMMGAEDFSFYLQERPGAYIFLGNGDSAGLHHPAYDFNDAAIAYGVSWWVTLAERLLRD